MSSITSRARARGQTLPVFVIFLLVLLGFAALAFDGGQMLLDRREQQNAADAAALAGARFLVDPANPNSSTPCNSPTMAPYCVKAVQAALQSALGNHYGDGTTNGSAANGATVTVSIPPGPESTFSGQPGYIEVQIATDRPSVIGGVLGFVTHRVGALGTAANRNGATLDASLIALNKTQCQSAQFNGNGSGAGVNVAGNIQVDSNCTGSNAAHSAFSAGGNSTVTVTAPGGSIDVVGSAYVGGSATVSPPPTPSRPYLPDPFASIPAPAKPTTLPTAAKRLDVLGTTPPNGCPGGPNAATGTSPQLCTFNSAGQVWELSPGYYPGGIKIQKGTVYLLPGIYWIGGGGFTVTSTTSSGASIYSVPAGYTSTTPPFTLAAGHAACDVTPPPVPSPCGGVMIYNSEDSANGAPFAAVSLGGTGGFVGLYPIQSAPYTGIVIFQDRTQSLNNSGSGDITLQGDGSNLWVNGAIYASSGFVNISGSGTIGSATQVIADTFFITGNGNLSIPFNSGLLPQTHAVGLVE